MATEAIITVVKQEFIKSTDIVLRIAIVNLAGEAENLSTVINILWAMAPEYTSLVSIAKSILGGGITIVAPAANGFIDVAIDKADTITLAMGQYVQEIVVIDSGSKENSVLRGKVELLPSLAAT